MLDLGTMRIGVTVDDSKAVAQLKNIGNETENAENKANKFKDVWGKVKKALVAVGLGKVVKDFTSQVIDSYSEFEQLEGGVTKLWGDTADVIMQKADEAYKTAGMSVNDYLDLSNTFSASLIRGLEGDLDKAAKINDMIVQDIADNASVYGKSVEEVTDTYKSLAKGNYQMLDNLNLGFAGTKKGMQDLADEASKITGEDYDISNFADIAEAIHTIQKEFNVTGNAAKEAQHTIEGSVNMMKASWQNWLVALGSGEGVEEKTQELMDSVNLVIKNSVPVIVETVKALFTGVADAIEEKLNESIEKFQTFVNNHKTAFTILATAIGALTTALIAYNAQAIISTVASGAETVAIWSLIAAETVATTVTTAFGAAVAFLTSPITLIILAIGALIAIIVLLAKNWDKVKRLFRKGWQFVVNSEPVQKVVELIQKVKTWWDIVKKAVKKAVKFVIKAPGVQKIIGAFKSIKSWWDKIKNGGKAEYEVNNKETTTRGRKHRIGLNTVPYDDYQAVLHKGEAILTAPEANQYQQMLNNTQTQKVSGVQTNGVLTAIINLDGKTIGEQTVNYINGQTLKFNVSPLI